MPRSPASIRVVLGGSGSLPLARRDEFSWCRRSRSTSALRSGWASQNRSTTLDLPRVSQPGGKGSGDLVGIAGGAIAGDCRGCAVQDLPRQGFWDSAGTGQAADAIGGAVEGVIALALAGRRD